MTMEGGQTQGKRVLCETSGTGKSQKCNATHGPDKTERKNAIEEAPITTLHLIYDIITTLYHPHNYQAFQNWILLSGLSLMPKIG